VNQREEHEGIRVASHFGLKFDEIFTAIITGGGFLLTAATPTCALSESAPHRTDLKRGLVFDDGRSCLSPTLLLEELAMKVNTRLSTAAALPGSASLTHAGQPGFLCEASLLDANLSTLRTVELR